MTKAVFFINPLSNAVKTRGSVLIQTALETEIPCHELHTFDGISTAIKDVADKNIDIIGIEGGDGTIHGVLSAFLKHANLFQSFPKFILLPGGMTNLVAKHVGVKKPTPAKIRAIINGDPKSISTELPLLRLQTSEDIHSGFFFSTGALPKATHLCFDKIYTQGITGTSAVRTTLTRVLFGKGAEREIILKPTPYTINAHGISIQGEHIVSIATTLPGLMIGLNPFWGNNDGAIRLTHIRSGARHLIRNMARMLRSGQSPSSSNKLARDGFTSWSLETATLDYTGPMVLDGEFLPQTNEPITLSTSRPLTFLK